MKNTKTNALAMFQLIAAIGVMNGHFLMELFPEVLIPMRAGNVRLSVLSYLYMGDLNVVLFFVIGGFLIPLSYKGSFKKVLEKWVQLMVPAIVLTIIVFALFHSFTIWNLVDDISIYLTGRVRLQVKEYDYIPYILYQLWFLFPFFIRWTICYIGYHLIKDERKVWLYLVGIVCVLIDNKCMDMYIGLIFGVLANEELGKGKKIAISAIGVGGWILAPIIFAVSGDKSNFCLNVCMYILLGAMSYCLYNINLRSSVLNKLLGLSTSIYYVHTFAIYLFKEIEMSVNSILLIYILFGLTVLPISYVAEKIIFSRVKKWKCNSLL